MRLLHRWRLDDDVLEMPEPALVRKTLARRPRARHDLDGLVEARLRFVRRNLNALELAVPITFADAEIEAAMRMKIESCRILGDQTKEIKWLKRHRRRH